MATPVQWAQMEFSSAHLGDVRRTRRLMEVASGLAACPTGTLPQAFPAWPDLKAAYRFFDNENVTREEIIDPHLERTFQACSEPGEYLLIEDTAILDFTKHRALQGAGPVARDAWSLGLLLHSTLALRVHAWNLHQQPEVTVVGLLDQQCWTRPKPPKVRKKKSRKANLRRPRESERWARLFERLQAPEQCSWTFVADRECDMYEAFARCNEANVDFVIRAAHPRALAEED